MEILTDDFSIFRSSFDDCLTNLKKVLKRSREKHLTLNWEKCHFMVKRRIVLGHVISSDGIKVDKVKIDLIANLPVLTYVKDVRLLLGHDEFYCKCNTPNAHLHSSYTLFLNPWLQPWLELTNLMVGARPPS